MAGIITRCKIPQLVAVVTVAITLIQVQSVASQNCNDVKAGECCRATTPTCPPGYFRDVKCDVTSTTTTTTMPSITDETSTDDDMFNSTVDGDLNTTDSVVTDEVENGTESSSVETPTDPPVTQPLGVNCRRCVDNCVRCNVTSCLECQEGYKTGNGSCIIISTQDQNKFPVGAVVGGAVGGVVFIVVVVVVAVCCCRRRKGSNTPTMDERLRKRSLEDGGCNDDEAPVLQSVSEHPESSNTSQTYENLAFKPDLTIKIQEGQDKVTRYTKDPTLKQEKKQPKDIEEEVIYSNQNTIDRNEINQLPEAPAPPSGAQSLKTKKERKSALKEPETDEMDEQQEIYYNDPATMMADADEGQEVYYNEPEEESPYMNYNPSKK